MSDLVAIVEEGGSERFSSSNLNVDDTSVDLPTPAQSPHQERQDELFAKRETKAVSWLRVMMLLVLVLLTVAVSLTVYMITHDNERDEFDTIYEESAQRVIFAFHNNAGQRVSAIENFALTMTSYAVSNNFSFPFVTLPDFETRGAAATAIADVISLRFVPIVTKEERLDWEDYSVEHQGWLKDGLLLQEQLKQADLLSNETQDDGEHISELNFVDESLQIPTKIYRVVGAGPGNETGPGPYFPYWQSSPAVPLSTLVNFNGISHPSMTAGIEACWESLQFTLGKSADFLDNNDPSYAGRRAVFNLFLNRWKGGNNDYQDDPVGDAFMPVFDTLYGTTKRFVGYLHAQIYWRSYFTNVLPESTKGMICVLENTCDQQFTYQIDGEHVQYLGPGDMHDTEYEDYVRTTEFQLSSPSLLEDPSSSTSSSPYSTMQVNRNHCLYSIRLYPSKEMEKDHLTNRPIWNALGLVVVFVVTSGVFLLYDLCVERRQQVVMETAVRSTAIVSSLFPENVRGRLYDEQQQQPASTSNHQGTNPRQEQPIEDTNAHNNHDNTSKPTVSASSRLKKFLGSNNVRTDSGTLADESEVDSNNNPTSQPIADSFQNCTVFFADVVGFTSWSSSREPAQVFRLLETVYGAFDRIANKLNVFKIETIGDCYMCVTGLPEPQQDHAALMAVFSLKCLTKMKQVTQRLSHDDDLGPKTKELTVRIGLHTGEVTAGVLRGQKARFQLFGDTVNTAARMESTGIPGRIQCSQTTADELISSRHGSWIVPRPDKVMAKGKGEMQTYWIQLKSSEKGSSDAGTSAVSASSVGLFRDRKGSFDMSFSDDDLESPQTTPPTTSTAHTASTVSSTGVVSHH